MCQTCRTRQLLLLWHLCTCLLRGRFDWSVCHPLHHLPFNYLWAPSLLLCSEYHQCLQHEIFWPVVDLLMHKSASFYSIEMTALRCSCRGACWAAFTCCMSHFMICNWSYRPCDRPLSLVSKKHSHMFKIGQFHSVVRPQWSMGPPGLLFMALRALCALTRAQRLQSERKNGFVLCGSEYSSRFTEPPWGHVQMSDSSSGTNKWEKLCCII